ncbi:hypothetical protein, partial [Acinetobacter baumannii]|uniref:hypothetical protein n=1 Tax=Acinetobacter baumannii TaxID=470 RepID=UPI00339AC74C
CIFFFYLGLGFAATDAISGQQEKPLSCCLAVFICDVLSWKASSKTLLVTRTSTGTVPLVSAVASMRSSA